MKKIRFYSDGRMQEFTEALDSEGIPYEIRNDVVLIDNWVAATFELEIHQLVEYHDGEEFDKR